MTADGLSAAAVGARDVDAVLEWTFRLLTPVDELAARAVRHRSSLHVGQFACCHVCGERRSRSRPGSAGTGP